MSRPIVAFARGCLLFPAARALVEEHAEAVDEDRVGEAAALYVDSFSPPKIDAAYLDRAPHLRMICSATAGYDNIDVVECTRRGIAVSNSQGSLTEAVADIALLHIIAAFRHIGEGVQWARSGNWLTKPMAVGDDVGGHTLGIIGLGAIGMAVAKRANACGMKIIYYNRNRRADDASVGARYVPFDELLRTAKCVVVLIPLNAETRGMFGAREFGLMRDAYFVNASRGAIVETDALVAALTEKNACRSSARCNRSRAAAARPCIIFTAKRLYHAAHWNGDETDARTHDDVRRAKYRRGFERRAPPANRESGVYA